MICGSVFCNKCYLFKLRVLGSRPSVVFQRQQPPIRLCNTRRRQRVNYWLHIIIDFTCPTRDFIHITSNRTHSYRIRSLLVIKEWTYEAEITSKRILVIVTIVVTLWMHHRSPTHHTAMTIVLWRRRSASVINSKILSRNEIFFGRVEIIRVCRGLTVIKFKFN